MSMGGEAVGFLEDGARTWLVVGSCSLEAFVCENCVVRAVSLLFYSGCLGVFNSCCVGETQ
jgi:hypothetical protein